MAELGATSAADHEAAAALALGLGIEVVGYRTEAYGVDTVLWDLDDVAARFGTLRRGDALLLKGSRVANLDAVAELLLTPPR
jgi:UDP-N-acetylmuramoyl-tripeptide--D-alanyl-D-alanine ligase